MSPATLIILAKRPQAGRSKTRLGASIGNVRAANLFTLMTRMTLDAAHQARATTPGLSIVLAVDPVHAVHQPCPCWPSTIDRVAQGSGDLGERLRHVMGHARSGPILLIGTDAPQVRAHHLRGALTALHHHDAVFGPAVDGGFWLAGIANRNHDQKLFRDVRWSTSHTLADVKRSLPNDWSIGEVETLRDIDELSDIDALGWNIFRRSVAQ